MIFSSRSDTRYPHSQFLKISIPFGSRSQGNALPLVQTSTSNISNALHVDTIKFSRRIAEKSPNSNALSELPYNVLVRRIENGTVYESMPTAIVPYLQNNLRTRDVVRGDLHGSAIGLLETVLYSDFITLPDKSRDALVQAIQYISDTTSKLNEAGPFVRFFMKFWFKGNIKKQYAAFQENLALIQKNPAAGNRKLIFIGDEITDRHTADPLSMAMIKKLESPQILGNHVFRIASNHAHSALYFLFPPVYNFPVECPYEEDRKSIRSFERGQTLTTLTSGKNTDVAKALEALYKSHFEKNQLFYYEPSTQILITHAPITKQNIKTLIDCINQTWADIQPSKTSVKIKAYEAIQSPQDVGEFTSQANAWYHDYIQWVFENRKLHPKIEQCLSDEKHGFLWERAKYFDAQIRTDLLPFYNQGVKTLIHGHDKKKQQYGLLTVSPDITHPSTYSIINLNSGKKPDSQVPLVALSR